MNINGVELIADGDMVVKYYLKYGEFEPESLKLWREACSTNGVMIDVGSYTGIYAIAASLKDSPAIAIEPSPSSQIRIQQNAEANNVSVKVLGCAAGRKCGGGMLNIKTPLSSANSMIQEHTSAVSVDIISLDSLTLPHPVAAIKIDVEGYEVEVLAGAREIIQKYHPFIITEALTEKDKQEQLEVMKEFNYSPPILVDKRNLIWK